MIRFTILDGKVIVDPTIKMIHEFQVILDYGEKKKDPEIANLMLLFVFWCCDLTALNPFRDVRVSRKVEDATKRIFLGTKRKKFTKQEADMIDAAMDAYNYFNEDALERSALVQSKKIDQINDLLDNTKPEVHPVFDEDGAIDKYVSNAKIISDLRKELKEMALGMLAAKETAKKIENTGRVRGNKKSSLIERGLFVPDNKDDIIPTGKIDDV
jgi:hypothetical protein